MQKLLYAIVGLLALVLVGCGDDPAQTTAPAADSLPASLLASAPPAGAIDVAAARKVAKDGEAIVVKGRVGGQKDPLASNRAIMTLADESLPTCDKNPADACQTPWDSCCEPADEIAAKTLSVQVVGADGRPIKAELAGFGGIAPKKQLVVAGIAKRAPGTDALVVQANQIYVLP